MTDQHFQADQARSQLNIVLESAAFRESERHRRLLAFLVESTLQGEAAGLKEFVIAAEVWDRSASFDPRIHSTVRVEVGRLRTRLDRYYAGEGAGQPIRFFIPTGGYAVRFEAGANHPATDSVAAAGVENYRLLEVIGRGGMGEVWKAHDSRLGREVALKFLPVALSQDPGAMDRFRQEARTAAAINHPNICTVYEAGEHGGLPFFAMELLDGETLKQHIGRGPIPPEKLLDWAIAITGGLAAAHARGIIHRDIKPANLFITSPSAMPPEEAKILDFGLAKLGGMSTAADALPAASGVSGTPGYLSPEQARGEELDARTDLYSLGVVLYEMATGTLPSVRPARPSRLNPRIPPEMDRIISKALEEDREVRYQHASELRADLKRLKRDSGPGSSSTTPLRETAAAPGRHRARLVFLTGAAAAAVLAFAIAWIVRPVAEPRITGIKRITTDGVKKQVFITDGTRVYYNVFSEDFKSKVMEISVAGGTPVVFSNGLENMWPTGLSPDGAEMLLVEQVGVRSQLWVAPVIGGPPRKLNLDATDAAWGANGEIVYTHGRDIGIARSDGTPLRKLVTAPGVPFCMQWSADSRRLRFTSQKGAADQLWEVSANGANLHRVLPDWKTSQYCGTWTPDQKYYLFSSHSFFGGEANIWELSEHPTLFSRQSHQPVRLTTGPMRTADVTITPGGKRVLFFGLYDQGQLIRYDKKAAAWTPYLGGISATDLSFSSDGKWLTYVSFPDRVLWRCTADGGQRLQLTASPMLAFGPHWSPNGKQILFSAESNDGPAFLYLVSPEGGPVEQITPAQGIGIVSADWSPDGESIVFSTGPEGLLVHSDPPILRVVNLKTRRIAAVPGSQGLFFPRWSPDGRVIAAVNIHEKSELLELANQKRTVLSDGGFHTWSPDGRFLYTRTRRAWQRTRISDDNTEIILDLRDLVTPRFASYWSTIAPDGSFITIRDTGTQDIYSATLDAP